MVPRSPFFLFTAVQGLALTAFVINTGLVNCAISHEFGGRSDPLNPLGSDLAASSYFYDYALGPDISEAVARTALATFAKDSHSAAFRMANLEVALANINKKQPDIATAQIYAKRALDGYYNLAKKGHIHKHQMQPLGVLCWVYVQHNQPEQALQVIRYQLARLEDQKHELQCKDEACDYMRLAEVYDIGAHYNYELGYYATAEEYEKKALLYSRMSDSSPSNHFSYFRPEQGIAQSLLKQEKYSEALAYATSFHRKAAKMSPVIQELSSVQLALIYEKMGLSEESNAAFSERAGFSLEQNIEKYSFSEMATAISYYADLLDARGQSQKASDLMANMFKSKGMRHETVANRFKALNRRAEFLTHADSHQLAVKMLESTLKSREAAIGSWSLDMAKSYALLAEAQAKLGQNDAAKANFDRALTIEYLVSDSKGPLASRHLAERRQLDPLPMLQGATDGSISQGF